jgi:hypothetical protein
VLPRADGEFLLQVPAKRPPSQRTLICRAVDQAPDIDGIGDEPVWKTAQAVATLDYVTQRTITLKAVHASGSIFLLVSYPDISPSITHKSFQWDAEAGIYKPFHDREDMFIFKWNMAGSDADLSLRNATESYRADIWFWKACRTDPVGYADDKWQSFSVKPGESAKEIRRPEKPTMFLVRSGDSGQSAYTEEVPFEYRGRFVRRFSNRTPVGSRADVRAAGRWRDGVWTIEFARKLNTGQQDDVALGVGGSYVFGVSCYEIAGGDADGRWYQPLYRMGDTFDRLVLKIAR